MKLGKGGVALGCEQAEKPIISFDWYSNIVAIMIRLT